MKNLIIAVLFAIPSIVQADLTPGHLALAPLTPSNCEFVSPGGDLMGTPYGTEEVQEELQKKGYTFVKKEDVEDVSGLDFLKNLEDGQISMIAYTHNAAQGSVQDLYFYQKQDDELKVVFMARGTSEPFALRSVRVPKATNEALSQFPDCSN